MPGNPRQILAAGRLRPIQRTTVLTSHSVVTEPLCRMKTIPPARRIHRQRRHGVAVVELAICLPLLVFILLATIETCTMLQLQQNLAVTAYEGSRLGIIPGIDANVIEVQCEMLLQDRNINAYSVAIDPADLSTVVVGDTVTVTVDADCGANSMFGGLFFESRTLSESVAMRAE